ncbi:hypothetical protein ZOSMA_169G00410 [Zostera marina]|uniref:Uncharacterized protein n=1 Tax=Zostera marina TaxID=29655 RepID=A0A0K9PTH1_ZOSMR|nr:hypothetical protein ZOSMA_169G00410 [Zostera marina]
MFLQLIPFPKFISDRSVEYLPFHLLLYPDLTGVFSKSAMYFRILLSVQSSY